MGWLFGRHGGGGHGKWQAPEMARGRSEACMAISSSASPNRFKETACLAMSAEKYRLDGESDCDGERAGWQLTQVAFRTLNPHEDIVVADRYCAGCERATECNCQQEVGGLTCISGRSRFVVRRKVCSVLQTTNAKMPPHLGLQHLLQCVSPIVPSSPAAFKAASLTFSSGSPNRVVRLSETKDCGSRECNLSRTAARVFSPRAGRARAGARFSHLR